jgi:superfamily II DNA or RNA helicase
MKLHARDYQILSKELIRNEYKSGIKKVLLWLATGGGKTFIFCDIIKDTIARNKCATIVVRGRKLVDQASERLAREGVEHGVMMAGHWNYRPSLPVQVCSIDTVISRRLFPKSHLIIIDEAHLAASPGYIEWLAHYNCHILSVTATPWLDKSLRHCADTVVHPITMQQLIDQGYLVPFRMFSPTEPDTTGIGMVNGDWNNKKLERASCANGLTGKVVQHWIELGEDRPTILFAVNIHHSKLLTQAFLDAGISAEHCDADTKDGERKKIIERSESGKTRIICNVGILCTGVDMPWISCISACRKTESKNLYIQQAGRGTRLFSSKKDCILLDHAGHWHRHGFATDEFEEIDLDGKPAKPTEIDVKRCPECFTNYRGKKCPECGVEAPTAPKVVIPESDEKLVEVTHKIPRGAFKNSPFSKRKKPSWIR